MGAHPGLAVPNAKTSELVHSVLSVNPCERRGHRAQDFKNTQCFCFLFGGAHPLRTGGGGHTNREIHSPPPWHARGPGLAYLHTGMDNT